MTFNDLGITPALVAALAKQNITTPTAIQAAACPLLLEGKDVYIRSETGTGKTLAYLLPLFCRMDPALAATQVMILAPTHELAIQIQRQSCDLAQNAGLAIRTLLLIGGTAMDRQLDKLKKKPQIVVGSPGRLRELIAIGKLKTRSITSVVIDEADQLLTTESVESVRTILSAIPVGRQLVFASATEQTECASVVTQLAPHVARLNTGTQPVNANIAHHYLVCEERDKPDVLRKALHAMAPERAIVFVHRDGTAETIAAKLAHHKIPVADLHGAFAKSERKQSMDDFRAGRVRVLIATDLAARGLDIQGVTHIFNLDAPSQSQAYLHRVGRTARAGAKGYAVSLLTGQEVRLVRRYESELGITITPILLRDGRVCTRDDVIDHP